MAKAKLFRTLQQPGTFSSITTTHKDQLAILKTYATSSKGQLSTLTKQQQLMVDAAQAWAALYAADQEEWYFIGTANAIEVENGGSGYDDTTVAMWPWTEVFILITNGGTSYADTPVVTLTSDTGSTQTIQLSTIAGAVDGIQAKTGSSEHIRFPIAWPWTGTPPSCEVTCATGSGATITAVYEDQPGYVTLNLTAAGSGYPSYPVTESTFGETLGYMSVLDGAMNGYLPNTSLSSTWYTEPILTVATSSGTSAQLTAGFYTWPYSLPTTQVFVSGGAVTSVAITEPGNQAQGLGAPDIIGPGTGATLYPIVDYIAPPQGSKAGQVAYPSGYTAFSTQWVACNAFHPFPLSLPATEVCPNWNTIISPTYAWNDGSTIVYSPTILNPSAGQYFHVTNAGSGYTSPPTVSVTSTLGTGMQAVAVLSGDTVSYIRILDPGYYYQTGDTVTLSGGGGSGATAELNYNYPVLGARIWLRKPKGQSQYANYPATKQIAGYWFVTSGSPLPDLTAAYVSIFGAVPSSQARFTIDSQLVDLQTGLSSNVESVPCLALGGVKSISGVNSPTGLTGPPSIDWGANPDPGGSYAWIIQGGVITSVSIILPGQGGISGSYGFVGYSSSYGCNVSCNAT